VAIANALPLEGSPTLRQSFFGQFYTAQYFRASVGTRRRPPCDSVGFVGGARRPDFRGCTVYSAVLYGWAKHTNSVLYMIDSRGDAIS